MDTNKKTKNVGRRLVATVKNPAKVIAFLMFLNPALFAANYETDGKAAPMTQKMHERIGATINAADTQDAQTNIGQGFFALEAGCLYALLAYGIGLAVKNK